METENELEWQKYDNLMRELECRIKRLAKDKCPAAFGTIAGAKAAGKETIDRKNETGMPSEDIRGHSFVKVSDDCLDIKEMRGIACENRKLREEAKFLKAEIRQSENIKYEIFRLKKEIESFVTQKNIETTKLFLKNMLQEKEINDLKIIINGRNFHAEGKSQLNQRISSEKQKDTGLLKWLNKPLIVAKNA
jgi:hypothetical protein